MNHRCKICNGNKFNIILNKKKSKIFTNREDSKLDNKKLICRLNQCVNCNFIFQKPSEKLRLYLTSIYKSKFSQLSQPLGEGNWGKERFNLLKGKLDLVYRFKKKSILEIGCGNGFILEYLNSQKFNDLSGIDPSIIKKKNQNSIKFYKKFVGKKLNLKKKYDFIFSIGFYEHVFDINEITQFSINHLKENGNIFLIVPNFKKSLENGNPDLFAHEHINYFTKDSLINHLKNFSLKVDKDLSDIHSICLYIKKSNNNYIKKNYKSINFNYSKKLNKNIVKVINLIKKNKCIIHGACNSLNNIISWTSKIYDFHLIDNDQNKIGKIFFGKKVNSIEKTNLNLYKYVIIIPSYFKNDIKKAYIKSGFNGKFISL